MAEVQRYISTSFWSDDWVDSLSRDGKLLYMYLLTNESTNIAGVYRITLKRMKDDTGIPRTDIQDLLATFEKGGKAYYFKEYIILPKWPKHQKLGERGKLRLGVIAVLQHIPKEIFDELPRMGYCFDLSVVHNTIIGRNEREGLSGTRRAQILVERGNRCESCGSTDKLAIHHIIPVSEGGSNDDDNLKVLCSNCHDLVHHPHKNDSIPDSLSGIEYRNRGQRGKSANNSDYDSDIDLDSDSEFKGNNGGSNLNEGKSETTTTFSFSELQEEIKTSTGYLFDEKILSQFQTLNLSPEESSGPHNFFVFVKDVVETKYPGKSPHEQRTLFISAVTTWENLRGEYPSWRKNREQAREASALEAARARIPEQCQCGSRSLVGKAKNIFVCSACRGTFEFDEKTLTYVFTKQEDIPSAESINNAIRGKKTATMSPLPDF